MIVPAAFRWRLTAIALLIAMGGCKGSDDPAATPKSVVKALFQAMYDDDQKAAGECIVQGNGNGANEFIASMSGMMRAMRRATEQAMKRFGPEFEKLAGGAIDMSRIDPKQIDGGVETIRENDATVAMKDGKFTFHLVRAGDTWKIDVLKSFNLEGKFDDPRMRQLMTRLYRIQGLAADRVGAEIEAGQFASAAEAIQELLGRMRQATEGETRRFAEEVGAQ